MATVTEGDLNERYTQNQFANTLKSEIAAIDEKFNPKSTFSEAAFRQSELFQFSTEKLHEPRLAGNKLFQNLTNRLKSFVVLVERFRVNGPTEQQKLAFEKTGFSFQYHIELHRQLKRLITKVINQRDDALQI